MRGRYVRWRLTTVSVRERECDSGAYRDDVSHENEKTARHHRTFRRHDRLTVNRSSEPLQLTTAATTVAAAAAADRPALSARDRYHR